jgi:quinoprotein glucose dehydrogenase
MNLKRAATARGYADRAYVLLLAACGLLLVLGGARLLSLGGSAYYLLAGLALVWCALERWRRSTRAAAIYAGLVLATLCWSLAEVGGDAWALAPRLLAWLALGAGMLVSWSRAARWHAAILVLGAIVLGLAAHAVVAPRPADPLYRAGTVTRVAGHLSVDANTADANGAAGNVAGTTAADTPADRNWPHYGNEAGGSRHSRLVDIRPDNVAQLELAWTYRTGDTETSLQVTPIAIDGTLYFCTGANDVIALDAATGRERWRFRSGAELSAAILKACRGVAYHRVPGATGGCATRIITNTIDARLIALDAETGHPCAGFGRNGEVSLLTGMSDAQGRRLPGYYYVTSAPAIVRGRIVLGGWVSDAQYWGEPSGVIRAYDAETGRFAWAFDMGRPDRRTEPAPGDRYTPSTPNSWAPMSADEELGLVFAPTGNTTGSDYYGALRRPFDEKYSSSVVALDAETGVVRWAFQTVHHDLWDYDVAPQPVAVDLPASWGSRRALLQATKTGEIFVLDRTTGVPLFETAELPAPTAGAVPQERVSPTQPASPRLPSFRGPDLDERAMWGLTPLDQLWCRIEFRKARYDGIYTPPGVTPFIQYPGILGGIEWGSVSVDAGRMLMIVNASRIANYARLIPRAEADREGRKPEGLGGHYGQRPQIGTPYAVSNPPFLSPLGVPCQNPPFGTLSAVDLETGRLAWTRRLGTARDSGPFGIPSLLPFPLGTPNIGGSVTTRSGLVFIGAAQDRYLRAFEVETGRELWRARLPAAALATPMTYAVASGRQFVVVAAGGADPRIAGKSDYIVAFALPEPRIVSEERPQP